MGCGWDAAWSAAWMPCGGDVAWDAARGKDAQGKVNYWRKPGSKLRLDQTRKGSVHKHLTK